MAIARSDEMQLVGYALARCGVSPRDGEPASPPAWLGTETWRETYALFYSVLGEGRTLQSFANSLKNARDAFDAHLPSGRVGWLNADGRVPTEEAMVGRILAKWGNRSDDDLRAAVETILEGARFAPVDGPQVTGSPGPPTREAGSMPSGRVWVTSFWDFNPEGDGYFGFTREGDREWFLSQLHGGDLVMVYATSTPNTEEDKRGKVLGFLEVERRRIRDIDRMSPEGRAWKVSAGVSDRWTYAVPVARAWRTIDLPAARTIAPDTLGSGANHQLIASRGALLSSEEAARALSLAVRPVDVFGETPLGAEEKAAVYVPSRGFPMSFGKRSSETTDGVHFLYALKLVGEVSAIVSDPPHLLRGKVIVKVGLAKDPEDRCSQHNAALPPAGRMRWKLLLKSGGIPDGQTALDAETMLKERFSRVYRSLGGEFFLCDEKTLAAQFAARAAAVR